MWNRKEMSAETVGQIEKKNIVEAVTEQIDEMKADATASYADALWSQVRGESNEAHIASLAEHCRSRGIKPETIAADEKFLKRFLALQKDIVAFDMEAFYARQKVLAEEIPRLETNLRAKRQEFARNRSRSEAVSSFNIECLRMASERPELLEGRSV